MRIGMVGLGRMGANMATRLLRGGHEVVVFDRSADAVRTSAEGGAQGAASLEELAAKLGAAGFGTRTSPSLGDVMARLKAKAGLPAAAQTL